VTRATRRSRGRIQGRVTCRDFAAFLLSYVDGELAQAEREAFDAHLAICPDCVRYLDQYLETIAAAPDAFDDDRAVDVPADLLQAILASRDASA
jgi:anti-sigma factor RsiW